ncbi:MAG: tetratricopeptide repeat protein [Bradymonadaceae bacterium]
MTTFYDMRDCLSTLARPFGGARFGLVGTAFLLLLGGTVWLAPVSQASALDKEELVQMSKLGLSKSSIKGAIDKADEDFKLTKEELGKLRLKGVSDEIIQYLEKTGHVKGTGPAADGGKDEPDKTADQPEDGAEPPPEKTGDQGPAPAPGQGPAPAPGDEEKEKVDKEKIEEKVQERIQKRKQKKRQKRKRQRVAQRLPSAKNALGSGDNMQAARVALKFLSLDPEKGSDDWYEAKFILAKALYNEGILSGAARPLREVVMAGGDRPHFEEAFRMLDSLSAKIGYQPPILEKMTQLVVKNHDKTFRSQFHYYLGKFFYDYDRNKLAVQYLDKVPEATDDYPRAMYLKGVAQLDPSIDDKPAALRNFERAIRAERQQEDVDEEILNMGYMALARVFYEVGAYDVALFYYQKIPRDSPRYAKALFEKGWTYFVKNDFKKALGTFHALHSPYYSQWYFPDLFILEATVYLNLCKFDYSKEALATFQRKYLDKRPALQKFLEETTDPKEYWKVLTHAYETDGQDEGAGLPKMFANAVLQELDFFNMYREVRLLRQERRALKSNIGALGDFGKKVLKRVERQLDTKIQEGGILVRQKLKELDQQLKKWDLKATQISFDIDSEQKKQLERRLQKGKEAKGKGESGTTLLIVANDWQPWPFEGEYWLDEVGNYRSKQTSRCIEQ